MLSSLHGFTCFVQLPNFNSLAFVSLVAAVMSVTYSTVGWTTVLADGQIPGKLAWLVWPYQPVPLLCMLPTASVLSLHHLSSLCCFTVTVILL